MVNKAQGWEFLMDAGFSTEAARFAFANAPKAVITKQGSDEKGNGFIIPKWNLGDLENFASKFAAQEIL